MGWQGIGKMLVAALTVGVFGCGAGGSSAAGASGPPAGTAQLEVETFEVPAGAGPHDVAPATDDGVWFTAQDAGYLGHLDPASGEVTQVPLGAGSRPHGVIVGADGAAWVTDGGLNAIVRVDGDTREVRTFPRVRVRFVGNPS